MFKAAVFVRAGRLALLPFLFIVLAVLGQSRAFADSSVNLVWAAETNADVVGYVVYYGAASRIYTNSTDVGNTTTATVTGLVAGATYYFAVTAYDTLGQESDYSNEISYTVPWGSNSPPSITLTSPVAGASYPAPASITLTAAVSANGHTITQVQFYNGATLLGSVTSPPYIFTWNGVAAGSYSLSAQAIYDAGSLVNSASAVVSVTSGSGPPPPTFISITGVGSFSPNLNLETVVLGASYTLTAIPGPGQQFAAWTGSIDSTNPTITFVMSPGFSLNAAFVPSPYVLRSGTFSGLFFETNQDQVQPYDTGAFTVQVTTRGTFSARFQMGASRYSFSGKLGTNGQVGAAILRHAASTLQIQLRLGAGTQSDQAFGTLSDGLGAAYLSGDLAVFNARTNPAPYAGNYTLFFPGQQGDPSLPAGNGFGTARVTSGGLVLFSGELADGTRVSQSATVSGQGLWPLYVPLYGSKGLLVSWLDFTNETSDDLTGLTSWIKPASVNTKYYAAGFTNQLQALGSTFVKPAVGGDILDLHQTSIAFTGGDLADAFANQISLGLSSRVSDLSSNRLSLSFSLSTGTFTGTVADPGTGKPLRFNGAVFQKANAGYGLSLGTNQSSSVELAPALGL